MQKETDGMLYHAMRVLIDLTDLTIYKIMSLNKEDPRLVNGLFPDRHHFLKQFRTVKVCSARRSGHSSAIQRMVKERFPDAFVFSRFHESFTDSFTNRKRLFKKFSESLRGLRIEPHSAIFIDTMSQVSASELDNIYRWAAMASAHIDNPAELPVIVQVQ